MNEAVQTANAESWRPLGAYSLEMIRLHGAGETLVVPGEEGGTRAHASIWWKGTPPLDGRKMGVVGHYEAADDQAGMAVLKEAVARLRAEGIGQVVGPMDGTTWRRYRLVTERGKEPPFFMEPDNPDRYVGHFEAAGFEPLARYYSSMDPTLEGDDPRVDEAVERFEERGVKVREIDVEHFDRELERVHELSLEAFASNFMYSPIGRREFVESYRQARALVRPGMVLMAEAGKELVGFMFSIPDIRRSEGDTAIAKTVAVRPGRMGAGLGSVLIELSRRSARRNGYRRLIYALMHESNRSTRIAGRFGTPFRRYTLYVNRGPA